MDRKGVSRGQRGRVYAGMGGVLAALGAILLVTSFFDGGSGTPVASGQEAPDLQIEKNALGLVDGNNLRQYRIRARNTGGGLGTDMVVIIDFVDDDIMVVNIHDVNPGWDCDVVTGEPGDEQVIQCTLLDNELGDQFEDIFFYDACDTIVRGSVDNDAAIFLNGMGQDEDTANPNIPLCDEEPTPTPTATPTGTPATPTATATATATPPTAVTPDIKPPVTGTGGGASHDGSSMAWIGLASLLALIGLLGWARRLSTRR
jgi:hypothetical protein